MNQHRKCVQQRCPLCQLRDSVVVCSRDLILKLLHINSSIPSKLTCEIIFWCTKLPIPQFFDEFSNAEKCFLHMTVTASFPVYPPTVDGSHDFLLFLMLCQNFLGDLFRKASAMASALHFFGDFRQVLPLTPTRTNILALGFLVITRQPQWLESFSNALQMREAFVVLF